MIMKYAIRSDTVHDAEYIRKRKEDFTAIERLVYDIKEGEVKQKSQQETLIDLHEKLARARQETHAEIVKLKEVKAAEIEERRQELADKKRQIAYYDRFMDVDKHDILEQIDDIRAQIAHELEQKEASIA